MKLFGTTFRETLDAFEPIHLGTEQSSTTKEDRVKAIGRIIVTLLLFAFAGYLISKDTANALGNTIIGGIIGYWLK